jgi:hypothetical protein
MNKRADASEILFRSSDEVQQGSKCVQLSLRSDHYL